jgi:pteridine reductase
MTTSFDGSKPVAVVTGAARRVGRAIALELARRGCDIVVHFGTSAREAESCAREVESLGSKAMTLQADLADTSAVERLAASALALPRVDILVHNASRYVPSPLGSLNAEDALLDYRINALAPLLLSARLASKLGASPLAGGGAIVCMTDMHALGRPRSNHAAYSMTKAALTHMVECLARDLAPHVRVNGVAPGVVDWPAAGPETDPAMQARYLARTPLARPGTPEDAAKAVAWLALEATYATGQIVRVDGGRWLT